MATFLFQCFKPFDYRQQFHPIIGRFSETFRQFFPVLIVHQDGSVPSRSWISARGTVSIDCDHTKFDLKSLMAMDKRMIPKTFRKISNPAGPIFLSSQPDVLSTIYTNTRFR